MSSSECQAPPCPACLLGAGRHEHLWGRRGATLGAPASRAASPPFPEQRGPALPQVSQWGAEGGGGLGQRPRAEWVMALQRVARRSEGLLAGS